MFLSKNLCRAVVALSICLAGGATVSLSAHAAGSCDTVIMDDAKILGNGADEVEAAAQSLQASVGADVHVVTTKTLKGYSSVEQYNMQLVKTCPSWQDANGGAKSTILIFTISMDRKLGISYGEAWSGAFTGRNSEVRIWKDIMAPQFADGNFADGFVAGMEESERILANYLHPDVGNPGSDGGGSDPSDNASTSPDINWKGFGIGAGILVFLVALGFGWFTISERKRAKAERKVVRDRALSARDFTTQITNQLANETDDTVRQAKLRKYSAVSDDVAEELKGYLHDLAVNLRGAQDGVASAGSGTSSPEDEDLEVGQYLQFEQRFEQTKAQAVAARDAAEKFNSRCASIDESLRQALQQIEALQSRHDALATTVATLSEEGIKIDAIQAPLTTAHDHIQTARSHQGDLRVLADIDKATLALNKAEAAEAELAKWRGELEQSVPELEARIEATTRQLEDSHQCFQRISTDYVESSWESVRGNGTEAQKRIDATKQLLADVKFDAGLDRQRWEDAVQNLHAAESSLDEASSLLTSITKLETNLANAKARTPKEIDDAAADIDKAKQFVASYSADLQPSHIEELGAALSTLEQARKELKKSQPDYLRVVKLALSANSSADNIYAAAASEHEAAERLRRQAASMMQEAAASISKAEEYIQDHRGDVRHGAKEKLDSARQYYAQAQAARSTRDTLSLASNADNLADAAYDKAKRDHRDAENERDEERRRRNDSYGSGGGFAGGVIIGSTTSGGWGSSGGSSGGGFGGSLGGSGGSFGGGGSLGGSSGGW